MQKDIEKPGRELIDELLNLYDICQEQCRVIEQIIEKLNGKN